ncbi:MAG: accessory gene regulator B family protein [Desulfotomaculaceae bacterium]|nr:accessory gene regulator B family protein [Desulfotomaculaceae bacterium]
MRVDQMAQKAAVHLTRELELDPRKTDTLRYGLEIMLCTLIKAVSLFSLAYLLGIIPEVAFALFFWFLYRPYSSGAHCEGYWSCLFFGLLVFLGCGELGLYLEGRVSQEVMGYLLPAGFLLSTACALIWAPGPVPYQQEQEISSRVKNKVISIVILCFWLAVSLLAAANYSLSIAISGLIAVQIQTFSFTPPGYRTIHKLDQLFVSLFKRKEVSTNAADV